MGIIFSPPELPPIPPSAEGIDVNFCKNPRCANFGVAPSFAKFERRQKAVEAGEPGKAYRLIGVGKQRPGLTCTLCGEHFSVKSNLAIAQERTRLLRYLTPTSKSCCTSPDCANHTVPVSTKGAYYRFGETAAGTPRYRCRLCGKTFAVGGNALKRQRITHQNKTILLTLTNKMPLRRIAKVTELNAETLYGKIDFIHRQCVAFAAHHERNLPQLDKERLYISVDRQEYFLNWGDEVDKRNVVLKAVGSADNDSGFVFGMSLNFDHDQDPETVEKDVLESQEATLPLPFRPHARLWTKADYQAALTKSRAERDRKITKASKGPVGASLADQIADTYEAAAIREDTEESELKDENQKLPEKQGMQVHEEYCLYGHFLMLKAMLPSVGKLRFFLDQDSGIRAAFLSAFVDDVKAKRADAFYVRIAKELTVPRKRALVSKSKAAFNLARDSYPSLSEVEVMRLLMMEEINTAQQFGKWQDRWAAHPLPDMSEPAKAMCYLTDLGGSPQEYDSGHLAALYLKASMRGIDSFFQQLRRSVNMLERPIQTASKARRTWYGYSPYSPLMVEKLLAIYRTMHNYVEVGRDGRTPALRLGLTAANYKPEDVLYFSS